MQDILRLSAASLPSDGFDITYNTVNEFYRLHWHEFYEIEFIISGSGRYLINGVSYPALPETLFFSTYMDVHEIIADSPLEILSIKFDEHRIEPSLSNDLHRSGTFPNFDTSLIFKLADAFREDGAHQKLYIEYLFTCILIEIVRKTKKSADKSSLNATIPEITQAMQYIHLHFRENITASDIAQNSGFSPNYFSTLFKEQTGISIKQHIIEHRIDYAKRLLYYTDLSVTDICYVVGFNSNSAFFKAFSSIVGVSPREYRQKKQNK